MLTGRLMNVLNVTTLDIPVAIPRLLEQAFSHVSRSNILVYFCISSYAFPLILTTLVTYFELGPDESRPDCPQELLEQLDMADINIDPFEEHGKTDEMTDKTFLLNPVGGGSTWEPKREE